MNTFKSNLMRSDTVLIQLNICSLCQQRCWYCYARKGKRAMKWNKLVPFEHIKEILKNIGLMKYNIRLSILGGEPTLHPKIKDIISETLKYQNIKTVEIFTNGLKSIKIFPIDDKIRYNFSFHSTETSGDSLLNNANYCLENNIKFSINCLFYEDNNNFEYFYNKIKNSEIKNHASINCVYNYISDEQFNISIPERYKDIYKNKNTKVFNVDNISYTLEEVYKNQFNNFNGWKCYKQNIWISVQEEIVVLGSKYHSIKLSDLKDFKISYDICVHVGCTDEDSLLYNRKEL